MEYFKYLESVLRYECPNCKSINFYRMSETRNEPTPDPDGLKCWNCKQEFFLDKVFAEMNEFDTEYGMFDDGEKE